MRIVVVTTSFPRDDDDPSGHFVRSSSSALAERGHEVHVVAPGGSALDLPSRSGDLIIHRAGGGGLFAWPGAIARMREHPLRLLSAGPFAIGVRMRLRALGHVDHAIAHWILPSAWPLLLDGPPSLEVIAHGADVRALVAAPPLARKLILTALLDRGARFVFAARSTKSLLLQSLAPALAERLRAASRVKPPAIDVPDVAARARELRASLDLGPGERLIVTACRLIASKRAELAIDTARLAGPAMRLVLVGDGPERAALESRAADLGGRVVFTGTLPRREALAWIGAADHLLHPSAVEAAPTVVREARALDVPVVACDAGDLAAWATDDAQIRIAEASPEALLAAIEAPST